MKKLHLIRLKNCPIFKQLQLEEALLRGAEENFCLINEGSSEEAIIMGISSKIEDHLFVDQVKKQNTSVIRRFSGGGTVFVDQNTFFVTFIFNKESLNISPFPEPILRWSEKFYKGVFNDSFSLRENDYTFGEKKFGGNAKYIQRDRWLLHTSFLWSYDQAKMNLLKNPKVAPKYRLKRTHDDFLVTLDRYFESQEVLGNRVEKELEKHFKVTPKTFEYPSQYLNLDYRKSTKRLDLS